VTPHLRPFSGLGPCDVLSSTPQALGPASDHICGNLRTLATGPHEWSGLGAARLVLETKEHPAKLKDWVLTPAGCTIDGLLELEEGGLRVALIKAVVRATRRAGELHDG